MKVNFNDYERNDLIQGGRIVTFEVEMVPYEDHRRRVIRVFLPEEYDGVRRFPVIYLHDGQTVFPFSDENPGEKMDTALLALKEAGVTCMAVCVDTSEDRGAELTPPYPKLPAGTVVNGFVTPKLPDDSSTPVYAEFMVKYLKPIIDENFMTIPDAANTCIGGISAGGSASYYLFVNYPEVYSKAMVLSPGLPIFPREVLLSEIDGLDMEKYKDHRIAFYNGNQELDRTSVDQVLAVYRKLEEKGMDRNHIMYLLDTRHAHRDEAWRKYIPELLKFLFVEDNSEY